MCWRQLTTFLGAWSAGVFSASAADLPDAAKQEMVRHYCALAYAEYSDAAAAALTLQKAIERFADDPTATTLANAKEAWIAARKPYLQTEVFRYYAGPIDDDDGPEPQINTWPLDESFIEPVPGGIGLGIIGDAKEHPEITPEVLTALNQLEGETNVSCGFHAIEFLLWGQDKNDRGPGNRPLTDYTTSPLAKRRSAYLRACAELLVRDLQYIKDDWAPGDLGNYRAIFEEGWEMGLQRILTGMSLLGGFELAGERMQVAYDTQEQEDEHSCFSDTTHLDILYNTSGFANLWHGTYQTTAGKTLHGKGLKDAAMLVDAALAASIDEKIRACLEGAKKIPAPFDQAIKGSDDAPGRKAVNVLIIALEDAVELLRQLGRKLGYDLPQGGEVDAEG